MRFPIAACAFAALVAAALVPTAPAAAAGNGISRAYATDFFAAKRHPAKKRVVKKKAPNAEYMRAVPAR
jgi:hypothetical protein